jgi:hypothetical protein
MIEGTEGVHRIKRVLKECLTNYFDRIFGYSNRLRDRSIHVDPSK